MTNLDVPPVMQPGDTIQPNIRIANLGPADTAVAGAGHGGPGGVDHAARSTRAARSSRRTRVANIPGIAQVSSGTQIFGDANLTPQNNIVTIAGAPSRCRRARGVYYIGVVVDPAHDQADPRDRQGRQSATP